MEIKVFVNTDDDVRLGRRIYRDVKDRGRTIASVLIQYNSTVKKSYEEFIRPTMKYADIIIPFSNTNRPAIGFMIDNIDLRLRNMGLRSEAAVAAVRVDVDVMHDREVEGLGFKWMHRVTGEDELMCTIFNQIFLLRNPEFYKYPGLFTP